MCEFIMPTGFVDENGKHFKDLKIGDSVYRVNWDIFILQIDEYKVCAIHKTDRNDVLAIQICADLSDNAKTRYKTIYVNRDSPAEFIYGLYYYAGRHFLKRVLDDVIEDFAKKNMYMIE